MSQENRLKSLEERVTQAKEDKFKAEARMTEIQRREGEILSKLKAKGFDPQCLAEEIETRRSRLENLLSQAEAIMDGRPPETLEAPVDVSELALAPGRVHTPDDREEVSW